MVDRKRLIELLRVPLYPRIKEETAEEVADYLIDNDIVTVVRAKIANITGAENILLTLTFVKDCRIMQKKVG